MSLFCLSWYLMSDLSHSLSQRMNPLLYFLCPLQLQRIDWGALVAAWWPAPAHYSCVSNTVSSQQFSVFIYQKITVCVILMCRCLYLRLISNLTSLKIPRKQHKCLITLGYIIFSLPASSPFKVFMNSQHTAEWFKKCMLRYTEKSSLLFLMMHMYLWITIFLENR